MTNRKILAGILTGLAAGAAITMVLSSKKGRKASRRLIEKGSGLKDDLKGKFNEFIDQVEQKVQGILK